MYSEIRYLLVSGSISAASTNTRNPNPYPVGIFFLCPPKRAVANASVATPKPAGRKGFRPSTDLNAVVKGLPGST
jgi:hypothetical protein